MTGSLITALLLTALTAGIVGFVLGRHWIPVRQDFDLIVSRISARSTGEPYTFRGSDIAAALGNGDTPEVGLLDLPTTGRVLIVARRAGEPVRL